MLESETITASALRYKLHRMPTQVKDEIQGTIEELRKFLCVTYLSLMFLLWMADKEYDLHMA
jgi:hypothetical protein